MQNEHPIPYLAGMPLVECSQLSDREREVLRGRASIYGKRLVPIGIVGAVGGLLLIQLAANMYVPIEVCFAAIILLAVVLSAAWVYNDQARRMCLDAAAATQRMVFRGNRTRRWGLWQRTGEMVVVTPGWIVIPTQPLDGIRACPAGSVAYSSPARRAASGTLTPNEYDELLFRTDRLLSFGSWRALLGGLIAGGLLYYALQMRLEWYGVVLFGFGSLLGLHLLRDGCQMFLRGLRLDGDCQRGAVLTTISAASPGLAQASIKYPVLEHSLSRVEFLPCGVVWSLDGKPAPWRLRGRAPDFVPPSALLPVALVARRP